MGFTGKDLVQWLPKLTGVAMNLTRNRDAAEELIQRTLLRALRHMNTFETGTKLDAWLITILKNEFKAIHRDSKTATRNIDDYTYVFWCEEAPPAQEVYCDLIKVLDYVTKLNPAQKEVIIMVANGYTYQEIADYQGVEIGTIKSRYNRAKAALKKMGVSDASEECL